MRLFAARCGRSRARTTNVPDGAIVERFHMLLHKAPRSEVCRLFAYPDPFFGVLVLVSNVVPEFRVERIQLLNANDSYVVPVAFC